MRANASDICLRDSTHTQLIESSGKESGKSRDIRNGAVAATCSDSNTDQVLLGDETFDVALRRDLRI